MQPYQPQGYAYYYPQPPAPAPKPPRNWWRWSTLAFAALAAWQCSEAQGYAEKYDLQHRQALYYTGRWQDVCRCTKSHSDCDDCNDARLCWP